MNTTNATTGREPETATEALVRSRNIPAVALLARLREPTLYRFLEQAGVNRRVYTILDDVSDAFEGH